MVTSNGKVVLGGLTHLVSMNEYHDGWKAGDIMKGNEDHFFAEDIYSFACGCIEVT